MTHSFSALQLAQLLSASWTPEPPASVNGFSHDTRLLEPGECFLALKTDQADGHDFLEAAMGKQACGALVERPRRELNFPQLPVPNVWQALREIASDHRKQFKGPIIGVTGSYGKTSTKGILKSLFGASAHASRGNWNNLIGLPLSLLELDPQKHLLGILEAGINQPGEMELLGKTLRADICILTGIGPVHLELLGSLEGIVREKAKLVEFSQSNAPLYMPLGLASFDLLRNLQRPKCWLAERGESCSYSLPQDQIEFYQITKLDSDGESALRLELFRSKTGSPRVEYRIAGMSAGMARNCALAILVAEQQGLSTKEIQHGLDRWEPESMRGQILKVEKRTYWLDCYNANPDAMIDSATAFKKRFGDIPRLWILGGMLELGEEKDLWHRRTAKALPVGEADSVIVLGAEGEALAAGLKERGHEDVLHLDAEDRETQRRIEAFEGAVFLKGSRKYRLERFVEENAACL